MPVVSISTDHEGAEEEPEQERLQAPHHGYAADGSGLTG